MTATPTATATPPQTNGQATYTYDGDGNMVKSVIGSVTTYYPRREYELRVDGTNETIVKYYFTTAGRTAMRVNGVLTWLLVDQVGSTSVTSDINGALGDTAKYSAYGEIRAGGTATDYLYTSQRDETELGLDYYVARFYDPVIGHFVQADTIVQDPYTSQDWDKYGYVRNNPVIHNDPSGHMQSENDRIGCQSLACVESDYYWGKKEMDEFIAAKLAYQKKKAEFDARNLRNSSNMLSSADHLFAKEPVIGTASLDYGFFNEYDTLKDFSSREASLIDLDAIVIGTGASGSGGVYGTAGMEDLFLISDQTRATYVYGGEGNAVGVGASGSAYVAAVYNLDSREAYSGQFTSTGVTISVLEVGITASFFWDSTKSPFSKYSTKGFALGYAPGAQISVWSTNTIYAMTWQSK